MNPSTEDMLNAIDQVNAETIFILPNNKNIILAAEQAASLTEDKKNRSGSQQDGSPGNHGHDSFHAGSFGGREFSDHDRGDEPR